MRRKTFYLPEEITTDLYTSGREWQTEDGKEYRGSYHRYITNEIYTGATWNSKTSRRLLPFIDRIVDNTLYRELKKEIRVRYLAPVPFIPVITDTIRKAGVLSRYFFKRINDGAFIEVNEPQYRSINNGTIDKNLYVAIQLQWYITGNIEDIIQGTVNIQGVRSKNLKQIEAANRILPGISEVLKNPLQFYTDNEFIVPKDINE